MDWYGMIFRWLGWNPGIPSEKRGTTVPMHENHMPSNSTRPHMCFVLFGVARMFLRMPSSQANLFFLWARVLSRPFKIVGENNKLRKESNWGHTWQLVPAVLSRLFRLAEIILFLPFFNWSVRCPGKKSQNNKSIMKLMKQLDGVFIPFNAIVFNILHHPGWTVRFTCLIQARAYSPGKFPLFGTGGISSWLVKGTKSQNHCQGTRVFAECEGARCIHHCCSRQPKQLWWSLKGPQYWCCSSLFEQRNWNRSMCCLCVCVCVSYLVVVLLG